MNGEGGAVQTITLNTDEQARARDAATPPHDRPQPIPHLRPVAAPRRPPPPPPLSQALSATRAHSRLLLGETLLRGTGAGGDTAMGRAAAEEAAEEESTFFAGADLVFVTQLGWAAAPAPHGAPLVAEMARRAGAVVMGVVTAPFHFEGKRRAELAAAAIEEMRGIVDVLVVVENDRLLEILPGGTAMEDAMRVADEVLLEAIRGVSSLITSSQARNSIRGAIPIPAHTCRANS